MSMFRFTRRRPSPALVVSCCSLFVALGGTSYAVATDSIGSVQIRDGSIHGVDVRDRVLGGEKIVYDGIGRNAVKEEALDAAKLGTVTHATRADTATVAKTAAGAAMQVSVRIDGRFSDARGVTNVEHLQTGLYNIVFERDVSHCIPAATLTSRLASPNVGAGHILVRPNGDDVRALLVKTGDSNDVFADHDFYLLVSC